MGFKSSTIGSLIMMPYETHARTLWHGFHVTYIWTWVAIWQPGNNFKKERKMHYTQ